MNTLIWHSAALVLAIATVALVLVTGHATLRSFALALASGAAIVAVMLAISSTGVLTERASGAMTPTIGHAGAAPAPSRSIRLRGIGWERGARPVVITVTAPGRWRPRIVRALPDGAGRIDVAITAPFAHRRGCTVTALQLTILGPLRASSPCGEAAGVARQGDAAGA
jgi:hypothetical protein